MNALPATRQPAAAPPHGGCIALVAPSSPLEPPQLASGLAALTQLGFTVSPSPDFSQADRYLAAPDEVRARALVDALTGADADVVLAARGGYGLTRLLPLLEAALPRLRACAPRLMAGFSDVTALHVFLLDRLGWRSLHGPVATTMGMEDEESRLHYAECMRGRAAGTVLQGQGTGQAGTATGLLVGGNLAVLMALAGTPWFPRLEGRVLLLEDVDERPHRLDRMLNQLMQVTQNLAGVAGVALGHFTGCDDPARGHKGVDTLRSFFESAPCPVVMGLPVGHQVPNRAVPHGTPVQLNAQAGTLTALEDAAAVLAA